MKTKNSKVGARTAAWALALVTLQTLMLPTSLQAQTYPTKAVRWVVAWPAGGLVDVAARQLANRLQVTMGQPIVVENKAGANGNIGADSVAKAAADGYTLLFSSSALTTGTAMGAKMQFNAVTDLERVSLVAHAPSVLVVQQASSIQTAKELVERARKEPGKLSYASAGIGSPAHLTGELFKANEKIFVLHVPYTGAPAAMTDQIAGRVDYQFANVAVALPQIKAEKVRALAVTSPQRMTSLPQVPTMSEAGMGRFDAAQWIGLLAPKGTDQSIKNKWASEINKVLENKDFEAALSNAGMNTAKPGTAEGFDTYFKQELLQWKTVVKTANIQPE